MLAQLVLGSGILAEFFDDTSERWVVAHYWTLDVGAGCYWTLQRDGGGEFGA
jgi:hypothetical protein